MDLKQCSDEELIVRYRDGDTDAMDFIFERYKHLVRKKAKAMFLAGGDNDDLIQEGMIGIIIQTGRLLLQPLQVCASIVR